MEHQEQQEQKVKRETKAQGPIGRADLDETSQITINKLTANSLDISNDISANDASFNSIFINNGSVYEKYTGSETITTTNIVKADPNFTTNLTNTSLDKKITAPDTNLNGFNQSESKFGIGQIDGSYSNGRAVSIYNNEILVGDCAPTSSKQGKAYIFKKVNGTWETTADVTFSPPTADAVNNLAFGWSVAISENFSYFCPRSKY